MDEERKERFKPVEEGMKKALAELLQLPCVNQVVVFIHSDEESAHMYLTNQNMTVEATVELIRIAIESLGLDSTPWVARLIQFLCLSQQNISVPGIPCGGPEGGA